MSKDRSYQEEVERLADGVWDWCSASPQPIPVIKFLRVMEQRFDAAKERWPGVWKMGSG